MRPWTGVAIGLAALGAAVLARRGGSLVRREALARRLTRRARELPPRALVREAVGTTLVPGNAVELVEDGRIFDTLEELIRGARGSIHLANFMWQGRGDPSERIGRALLARRPGVVCRVVLDGFGSKNLDRALAERLRRSGVELRVHRGRRHFVRFNHRRIVVVDGRVGVTGGFGIYESWLGRGEGPQG
ncbi:MAG TPA: phospholipase D-like domain-containing protein, partial [Anaeromyxobacteraceae bacterium]|nr:phospholipase D-like domain-containing protein [Anaeromyxobacteraceae bacterium]